jgi:hypothetical protein
MALLKKKRGANLRKGKARNYKMILNILTAVNRGITQGTIIRN